MGDLDAVSKRDAACVSEGKKEASDEDRWSSGVEKSFDAVEKGFL
jgi:hypothetical protein